METAGFFENIGNHLKTPGQDKNKSFRRRENLRPRAVFSKFHIECHLKYIYIYIQLETFPSDPYSSRFKRVTFL
jgi:hypothetical protein